MNTIAPALKLLCREGMSQDSPLKIRKALKLIDKDSKKYGWDDEQLESMPPEWQWRVCTARLQLGLLDYRGWKWRNGRGGHDPFNFPVWKSGLPIYPVQTECREPEKVGRLLVYSEQGAGDQLMFAQALRHVLPYADEVTLDVEPRLAPIFERTFPEFKVHGLKDLRDASWIKEPFDAKIMMGDVVARFMRAKSTFKSFEMTPSLEKIEYWRKWLENNVPKPWVGFSWAGRQGYLDPELADDGWVNLQYGEWEPADKLITPPIDLKEDLEDVFGILANLDNTICVPNTLAHMAGCMGKPCDVVMTPGSGQVNNAINWRWGMPEDDSTIWHPSIKIYRSTKEWLASRD